MKVEGGKGIVDESRTATECACLVVQMMLESPLAFQHSLGCGQVL